MTCRHLYPLEAELISAKVKETYRGAVWSHNCREWVYFEVVFDIPSISSRINFAPCVQVHENLDPKSGTERGFACSECHDAIMGLLSGDKVYRQDAAIERAYSFLELAYERTDAAETGTNG